MSETKEESWEVAIGGNFLQVWEKGRYGNCKYLDYENGKVCDIALLNVHESNINYDEAIKMVMPRAHAIARSPSMLALLEKALPIIQCEASNREAALDHSRYSMELRDLANEIQVEIDRAKGKGVSDG